MFLSKDIVTFWLLIAFVLCGSLLCESSQIVPRDLGWLDVIGQLGNLSQKYQPLTKADAAASVNARYFIEKFRHFFPTGLGGIPPLDPYTNDKPSPTTLNTEDIQGTINLAHFIMSGAQEFNLDRLEIRLHTARVDFAITFPELSTDVDYYANIEVDQAHSYFAGHANVTLINVAIMGALSLTGLPPNVPSRDQILQIDAIEYELSTSNALYNLRDSWSKDEIPGRRRHLRSIHGAASLIVRTIAQEIAEQASEGIAVSMIDAINKVLSYYTAAQIIAVLLPDDQFDTPVQ